MDPCLFCLPIPEPSYRPASNGTWQQLLSVVMFEVEQILCLLQPFGWICDAWGNSIHHQAYHYTAYKGNLRCSSFLRRFSAAPLPIPNRRKVVSQPSKAWTNNMALHTSRPKEFCILWCHKSSQLLQLFSLQVESICLICWVMYGNTTERADLCHHLPPQLLGSEKAQWQSELLEDLHLVLHVQCVHQIFEV